MQALEIEDLLMGVDNPDQAYMARSSLQPCQAAEGTTIMSFISFAFGMYLAAHLRHVHRIPSSGAVCNLLFLILIHKQLN